MRITKLQRLFLDILKYSGHWDPFHRPLDFGTRANGIRIANTLFKRGWIFRQIIPTRPGRATYRYFLSREGRIACGLT